MINVLTSSFQPNGANLTGGGTGSDSAAQATQSTDPYVPFNGQSGAAGLHAGVVPAVMLGALLAVAGLFARM